MLEDGVSWLGTIEAPVRFRKFNKRLCWRETSESVDEERGVIERLV